MSTAIERAALRRELRARRRAIPAATRIAAAEALAGRVLSLPMLPKQGHVAGYWAMDGEIALHALQLKLPAGLAWCLPLLDGDGLRFAPWRPGDALATNRFGIPEPDLPPGRALPAEAMALVLLPLVGFDAQGTRLGMGGGFYDRAFAFRRQRPAPPLLVGVGFEAQRMDALAMEEWDVRLDLVCTESATHHGALA